MKLPKGFHLKKTGRLEFISCDAVNNIPGFVQAFTTRKGGVSAGPYNSLNAGRHTGDNPDKVDGNIKRIEKAFKVRYASAGKQVHGDKVLLIRNAEFGMRDVVPGPKSQDPGEGSTKAIRNSQFTIRNSGGTKILDPGPRTLDHLLNTSADALITNIPGIAVAVRVADCVGTIIIDPEKKVVAAVHSGWRGIANKLPLKTVNIMEKKFKSGPAKLIAVVSPAIGPCCYEVGGDVIKLQKQRVFSNIFIKRKGKVYMDLWKGVENLLLSAGLKKKNIHICRLCTSDNPGLFFSHRRDKGRTGRMVVLGAFK